MKFDQIPDSSPHLQNQDAEIRLNYIKNNDLENTVLIRLANNDEDIAVRLAAIDQLKQLKKQQKPQKPEKASSSSLDTDVLNKNLIHQLLQFENALETGKIKQAQKIQQGISRKIRDKGISKSLLAKFETFSVKLKELKDWQGYATLPKREMLCKEMTEITKNDELLVSEKAEKIIDLQNQWKNLGASDSNQAQKLWLKFKKTGERAYEPCAKYFSTQKEIRNKNLKEKEKICVALEALVLQNEQSEKNWTVTDWRNFADLLEEVQKEWRRFDEVSREKYKRIQLRYKTTLDILHGKINTKKSANHKLRSDLIEEAKNLLRLDFGIPEKVERIKELQRSWKAVGITERRVDQKLWKQFRHECDSIFALRSEVTEAKKQNLLVALEAAQRLYKSLEELVEANKNLDSDDINKLRKSFRNVINNEDNQKSSGLKVAFQELLDKAKKRIEEQSELKKRVFIKELKRRAALCKDYEMGALSLVKVEASWELGSSLPTELAEKLRQRLYDKQSVNIEEKERLCLRLEILADIEPPEESQSAKLAYQVERLNKELSLGQKERRSKTEQISEIQSTWYCLPVNRESESLSKRFLLAETKLGI